MWVEKKASLEERRELLCFFSIYRCRIPRSQETSFYRDDGYLDPGIPVVAVTWFPTNKKGLSMKAVCDFQDSPYPKGNNIILTSQDSRFLLLSLVPDDSRLLCQPA